MSHGFSVRFLLKLELAPKPSVMLSVCEIVDASYQGKKCLLMVAILSIRVFRLRISFHWPMKVNGLVVATAAGLQFYRRTEEPSILCRTDYCLRLIYTNSSIAITSQLTLMYVYLYFL